MTRRKQKKAFNLVETTITLMVFGIVCVFFANLSINQFKIKEKSKDVAARYDYEMRVTGSAAERDIRKADLDIDEEDDHKNGKKGVVIVVGNDPEAVCTWDQKASPIKYNIINTSTPTGCLYVEDTSEKGQKIEKLKLRFSLKNKSRQHEE